MHAASLPDNPAVLKAMIAEMATRHEAEIADRDAVIADNEGCIDELQEQVRLLRAVIFHSNSERQIRPAATEVQYLLFDEAEAVAAEIPEVVAATAPPEPRTRKQGGRRPIAAEFPRVEVIHDIPDEDKVCPCGCTLTRIGEEVSEKYDFIPAKLQVLRHIRPKYACRACEGVEDDGPTVKCSPMPLQLIPQGIASPSLVAYVLASKFVDGLPFYRQERMFQRMGMDIPRATMCGWTLRAARACEPLIKLLHEEIRSGPIINLDETTVQVLKEPGRKNTSKSFMWLARGGPPDKPGVLFRYAPSRAGAVAEELVGEFTGFLQTDGYAGYNALGDREGIVHVGCLAHVRRKFVDAVKAGSKKRKDGTAQQVLDRISKLYDLERRMRKDGLKPDQIQQMRQERVKPLLDKIKAMLVEREPTTPPKSLLGRAISYALGQWERIEAYLQDGRLRPDNNLAENAIRPFAVGRKNWLFSGSPAGAEASAALYSLVETAKANGLEPLRYLHLVFERLPQAASREERQALLPQHLDSKIFPA